MNNVVRFLGLAVGLAHIVASGLFAGESVAEEWHALEKIDLNSTTSSEAIKLAREKYPTKNAQIAWAERTKREFRARGVALWKKYPNSAERFRWLAAVTYWANQPNYWQDVDLCAEVQAANEASRFQIGRVPYLTDFKELDLWLDAFAKFYPDAKSQMIANPNSASRMIGGLDWEIVEQLAWKKRRGMAGDVRAAMKESLFLAEIGGDYRAEYLIPYYFEPVSQGVDEIATTDEREWLIAEMNRSSVSAVRSLGERAAKLMLRSSPPAEIKSRDLMSQEPFSLSSLRGKIVILDFWMHPGCPACIAAMPRMQMLAERYRDRDVVVLGVNVIHDPRRTTAMQVEKNLANAREIITKLGVTYKNVFAKDASESEELLHAFCIRGTPQIIVLDRDGRYFARTQGDFAYLERKIWELLEQDHTKTAAASTR